MAFVIGILVVGWVAAALIGTQAYFRGEQSKPIHERNWNSDEFDRLAEAFTGNQTDYSDRTPAYSLDAFATKS
ncbi:photosystem II protein, Psb35-related [Baaleninema sp.]|uniref:photosystem II protein, Psb35-related n=1 Tax=Baaleninema sp. TaxID=3101197 RepID=UPI003CFC6D2E